MKNLKLWIGLAVSAALLVWVFLQVDLAALGRALAETNYLFLLLCLPAMWLLYVIRAIRWDFLLRPVKKVGYTSLLTSTVVGFAGNMVLPARLGEIMRIIDLGRRERISKTATLATIVLERILDGLAIVGFMLAGIVGLGLLDSDLETVVMVKQAIYLFLGVYGLVILGVVFLVVLPETVLSLLGFLLRPFPDRWTKKIQDLAGSLVEGLGLLRRPRLMVWALIYTCLLWMINPLPFFLLALGVGHPVTVGAALFVQGLVCLAVALPSAPGYVGVIHAAITFAYADLLGMPPEKALAVAIIYHGAIFLFTVLYCLTFVARGKVSLLDLGRMAGKEEAA